MQTRPNSAPVVQLPQRRQRSPVKLFMPTKAQADACVAPYLAEAKSFIMNTDFNLEEDLNPARPIPLNDLWNLMRRKSDGKLTVQLMSDKITLHGLIQNLGVPQMPLLHVFRRAEEANPVVIKDFLLSHFANAEAEDLVFKPTHLCNSAGFMACKRPSGPDGYEASAQKIAAHVAKFLAQKPLANESAAMQSVKPAFIVQPRYKADIDFSTVMELRVIVLWGKARLAVWWWGEKEHAHRNAWIVRRPATNGKLSDEDAWEVVHHHHGHNPGIQAAWTYFQKQMPAMAKHAEAVAKGLGAPFLRGDFFLGSPTWGVRLNEVAYTSSIPYQNLLQDGARLFVDDAPAIARILQEGFRLCRKRAGASHFLSSLGVQGTSYPAATVTCRSKRPSVGTAESDIVPPKVSRAHCETPRVAPRPILVHPTLATRRVPGQSPHGLMTRVVSPPRPVATLVTAAPLRGPVVLAAAPAPVPVPQFHPLPRRGASPPRPVLVARPAVLAPVPIVTVNVRPAVPYRPMPAMACGFALHPVHGIRPATLVSVF